MIEKKNLNLIAQSIPVPSIDLIIMFGKKFLLVKRLKNPAKNKYTFVGGILHKKIPIKNAIKKIVKREINLNTILKPKLIDVRKFKFKKNFSGNNKQLEYISSIFLIKLSCDVLKKIRVDHEHSGYKVFTKSALLKNKDVLVLVKKVIQSNF